MIKNLQIRVRGKVQKVGFRFTCMEIAYRFNIRGYVKNLTDGSVYVEAEGEEQDIEHFMSWCKKGPLWSKVVEVIVEEGVPKGFKSFDIRH